MTSTPTQLSDSWIELGRITPPFSCNEEYLRLLKEAQRESNHVSLASSTRDSPHNSSPKSPPNSPNICPPDDELKNIYINYCKKESDLIKHTDWIWEWSSRPDQQPPKNWKFEHPSRKTGGYSIRLARIGKNSLFSKEVLYSLLLTNILSLILGAGLGLWLSKRKLIFTRIE